MTSKQVNKILTTGAAGVELPRSPEAEQATLGAVLSTKAALVSVREVLDGIVEPFAEARHNVIWSYCLSLSDAHSAVDVLTVNDALTKSGLIGHCGGSAYLTDLVLKTPMSASAKHYARIVAEKWILRQAIVASLETIARCKIGVDAFDELDEARARLALIGAARLGERTTDGVFERPEQMARVYQSLVDPSHVDTIRTGFEKLDADIGGLRPGELVTIAGRPGSGKSALAKSMGQNMSGLGPQEPDERKKVVLIQLEMTERQTWARTIGYKAKVNTMRFDDPKTQFTHKEREAIERAIAEVGNSTLYVETGSRYTLGRLEQRIERLVKEGMLDVLMIDQSNKLYPDRPTGNKPDDVETVFKFGKQAAKDFNIPIVYLHQLNRDCEKRNPQYPEPMLSDLRDSGGAEQESDIVLMTFRPEVYEVEKFDDTYETTKGKGDVIVAKNRNGRVGKARLCYRDWLARWDNLEYIFDDK